MSDKPLPVVTFDGVPAHRVWRDAEGHVCAELPRPETNWRIVDAFLGVERDGQVSAPDSAPLREFCPSSHDISAVPSDDGSHRYGRSDFGELLSHVSRVTCPTCGYIAMRRHQVPFKVRG